MDCFQVFDEFVAHYQCTMYINPTISYIRICYDVKSKSFSRLVLHIIHQPTYRIDDSNLIGHIFVRKYGRQICILTGPHSTALHT